MQLDLAAELATVGLVFARLGTALMVVPGFGEHYVLLRLRLLLGLACSLLLAPVVVVPGGTPVTKELSWVGLVAGEIAVGLLLGLVARLALAAVHVGGSLVALQSGLAAAAILDPGEATPSSVPTVFLTVAALAMLFAADLHHLLLRALAASYAAFPLAGGVEFGAAAELLTRLGGDALATGVRIAAPLLLAGMLVNLALGGLGRLVPALPILFLALPLQLLLALIVLELGLPAALALVHGAFRHGIAWLDPGG